MKNVKVVLAGLPGDMATRVKGVIDETKGVDLAEDDSQRFALTGDSIKGEPVDIGGYYSEHKIVLIKSEIHNRAIGSLMKRQEDAYDLVGINFATAEGYDVNFLFAENNIPFISGVTGASKERESELVKAVQDSETCAIIDKNMSVPLVVFGTMLEYVARTFPGSLHGFSGYGIDSHQSSKKDPISGTLVKWTDYIKALGVNFVPVEGDRTGVYGHGDHFIRVASPDGTVKLSFQTEILGRDTYAQGTIQKGLPFLVEKYRAGEKGRVYSMMDALKIE